MHFFYLDESGDSGGNLSDPQQPIFVMGGISVRDSGWNETHRRLNDILAKYFNGVIPIGFELHAHELLSPRGEGPFVNHAIERRLELTRTVLGLLQERSHDVHLVAFDKQKMQKVEFPEIASTRSPYLLEGCA